ncbi:hypothetical protein PG997_002279 [Apiospora hydei]|uniref:Uncharacterized protein n=1 Tax=Apiospora hydei TaxID=1337664 RepID=A0ABR1X8Z7_9PEZI
MSPAEPEILAALASYREHIGSRSHHALSAMIPEIQAADPDDPELFESDEEWEEARLDFVLRLASQLALDGASVSHDAVWRDRMRGVYVRGVLQGLNERCSSGLITAWEFPADLAIVLERVDSLEGPGWPMYREEHESV